MNNIFIKKTITFFQDISRSEIIIQAILVGLISGILVVLFKVCITDLFNFIQRFLAPFLFTQNFLFFLQLLH